MSMRALFFALLAVICTLTLSWPDTSDAARIGGGRSFGSKPSMSTPAPATVQPRSAVTGERPGMNQAARQPGAMPRPSSGMLGGLVGGLLAGTLLGSLLGGHGFAGGGLLDLVLLGVFAFLGYKIFSAFRNGRRPAPSVAGAGGAASGLFSAGAEPAPDPSLYRQDANSGTGWDRLRPQGGATAAGQADVPAGFDTEEFLRGAKMAYTRLQDSWDKRDMGDIAQFTTPAVQRELRAQQEADPTPSRTEVLLVNAHLLAVTREDGEERAQVLFDVVMRESPEQQAPATVREVWHFVRPLAGGNWKLDGIQQVAD